MGQCQSTNPGQLNASDICPINGLQYFQDINCVVYTPSCGEPVLGTPNAVNTALTSLGACFNYCEGISPSPYWVQFDVSANFCSCYNTAGDVTGYDTTYNGPDNIVALSQVSPNFVFCPTGIPACSPPVSSTATTATPTAATSGTPAIITGTATPTPALVRPTGSTGAVVYPIVPAIQAGGQSVSVTNTNVVVNNTAISNHTTEVDVIDPGNAGGAAHHCPHCENGQNESGAPLNTIAGGGSSVQGSGAGNGPEVVAGSSSSSGAGSGSGSSAAGNLNGSSGPGFVVSYVGGSANNAGSNTGSGLGSSGGSGSNAGQYTGPLSSKASYLQQIGSESFLSLCIAILAALII